eukprot:scaffold257184_cov103-Cyclotella_meneghiniana.AAC.1
MDLAGELTPDTTAPHTKRTPNSHHLLITQNIISSPKPPPKRNIYTASKSKDTQPQSKHVHRDSNNSIHPYYLTSLNRHIILFFKSSHNGSILSTHDVPILFKVSP